MVRWPHSIKLFISLMLCVAGLGYLALLGSIWLDTEMKISLIAEGYGTMGTIELMQHSFQYLFWFLGIFSLTFSLFSLTRFPETIKRTFAGMIPVLILTDVGSAWLIRYHGAFAWVMAASGLFLAVSFLVLFLGIQAELWCRQLNDL